MMVKTDIIMHFAKIFALVLIMIIGLFFRQHMIILIVIAVILGGYEWYELSKKISATE